MPRPISRSLTALAIVAVLAGLVGWAPRPAIAGTAGDAPAFERVATQPLTLPSVGNDGSDSGPGAGDGSGPGDGDGSGPAEVGMAWRATTLPTLTEGATPVPFAPGFLYSPDAMLLVYGDNGHFSRLPAGDAMGMDGVHAAAPVAYDGSATTFLAVEFVPAADAPDDATPFSVPTGEWDLTLWRLELPDGAAEPVTLEVSAVDAALPSLVVVTEGDVDLAGDDDGAATPLSTGDDGRPVDGPVSVTADAAATVLVATIAPPGAVDASPAGARASQRASGAGGSAGGRGGDSGGGSGGGGDGGSGASTRPSTPTRPSASPSASAPSDPATDTDADADADGLTDAEEAELGTDPAKPDSDADGLDDVEEIRFGTDPLDADTDHDGATDDFEVGRREFVGADSITATDPLNSDTDGDGLLDGEEHNGTTWPNLADTDHDGYSDGYEVHVSLSDPNFADTDDDRDGLLFTAEAHFYTNPNDPDSDDDCLPDGVETGSGFNPLQSDSDFDGVSDYAVYTGDPAAVCNGILVPTGI